MIALSAGTAAGNCLFSVAAISGAALCRLCSLLAIGIIASTQLVRFAWGRASLGRWLLAVMLVAAASGYGRPRPSNRGHRPGSGFAAGAGHDDHRAGRFTDPGAAPGCANTITHQISDSREFDPTVGTILEELRRLTRAKAAWFRTLEGEKLELAAHRGLSQAFVEKVATIETAKA